MKPLIPIIFLIGLVSAKGSGPYLPSGWRPEGPAFFLPSEVQKPAENPLKDIIFHETGVLSSGLKEYGPPKVDVALQISNQGLPDVTNELTFFVDTRSEAVQTGVEVNAEQVLTVVETTLTLNKSDEIAKIATQPDAIDTNEVTIVATTEEATEPTTTESVSVELGNVLEDSVIQKAELAQLEIDTTTEILEQKEESLLSIVVPTASIAEDIADIVLSTVATTASDEEDAKTTANLVEENVEPTVGVIPIEDAKKLVGDNLANLVEENVEPTVGVIPIEYAEKLVGNNLVVKEEIPAVVLSVVEDNINAVKNIVGSLANYVQEISAGQVQAAEGLTEIKTKQELFTFDQVPEGFLEYGPPGFKEYGPPGFKEYGPPKEKIASTDTLENNKLRKRRFSPKFMSSKATH